CTLLLGSTLHVVTKTSSWMYRVVSCVQCNGYCIS
ncbi:unnamed protein product, partial [Brassica oleracea]